MWLSIKLVVISAALALTACSSQQSGQYQATRLVVDWEQVQRVENAARGQADVIWVNYPYKRLDANGRVVERINQHGEVIASYPYGDSGADSGAR
jgi:hypothetical protein